jgi:hypothetical protein
MMTVAAVMAPNLDNIAIRIFDQRFLLGEGHCRCRQGRRKCKSAGRKSD